MIKLSIQSLVEETEAKRGEMTPLNLYVFQEMALG